MTLVHSAPVDGTPLIGVQGAARQRASRRIAGLDGLRAFAVASVFLHHSLFLPGNFGSLGVWVFFVLSGFLVLPIARSSIDLRATDDLRERLIRTAHFSANRFLRIFPIYYVLLGALGVLALAGVQHKPIPGYIAGAPYFWTYTTNLYIAAKGEFIDVFTHLWSLAAEFQFYVIVAFMILLVPRGGYRPLLFVALALSVAWTIHLLLQGDTVAVYVNPIVCFWMMLLGGATAMAVRHAPFTTWLRPRAKPLVSLAALICVHLALNIAGLHYLTYFVTPMLSAMTIAMIAVRPDAVAALEWAPLRAMGVFSYGFYLYHLFVIAISRETFAYLAGRLDIPALAVLFTPVAFVATLGISWLSWHLFESRILAHKFTYGRAAPAPLP